MKNLLFTGILFLIALFSVTAQTTETDTITIEQVNIYDTEKSTLGLGIGQDYGGIGVNLTLYPQKNIGLFAGGGYAVAAMSYNVGVKLRGNLENDKGVSPYATFMYGYNAGIKVENAETLNKLFYGGTVGFGIDTKPRRKRGYWSFALLFPLRSGEVDDYMEDIKNNHGVEFENDLLPFSFSIGYKFMFQ